MIRVSKKSYLRATVRQQVMAALVCPERAVSDDRRPGRLEAVAQFGHQRRRLRDGNGEPGGADGCGWCPRSATAPKLVPAPRGQSAIGWPRARLRTCAVVRAPSRRPPRRGRPVEPGESGIAVGLLNAPNSPRFACEYSPLRTGYSGRTPAPDRTGKWRSVRT